ncbi:MAG: YihY/virulence factor BrkB family protein [Chitinophagaceae bacterium]|nr:YihY/virulence factor BrkB family protein [Chitinophagaceae bacterium]
MNTDVSSIIENIRKYSGWDTLVELAKIKGFPGHRDISVYEVLSFLFMEMGRDSILIRASSISFNFFVAIFPAILVMFTIIPYIPVPNFQSALLNTLSDVLPHNVYDLLNETIEDIVTREQGGLLSVSIILSVYYASRGVMSLMNAFDKALPTFRKRNFLNNQLVAFKILILLFLLLVVSITLFIGGEGIIKWIMRLITAESSTTYFWFTTIRWISVLAIIYFSIALIYYFGPATHNRWRFFSAGATLACALSIISSIIFSWLIDQFGQYNKLYGSIGTLLVMMIWLNYNSLSLLIGFELNASIEMNKNIHKEGSLEKTFSGDL